MFLRWIYKTWNFLLKSLLYLTLAVVVILTLLVGIIQFPQSKEYITRQLTSTFDNQYEGTLKIDRISGWIPLNITLHQARVFAPSDTVNPVISIPRGTLSLNLWNLLQRNITITGFELFEPELKIHQNRQGTYPLIQAFQSTGNTRSQIIDLTNRDFEQFQIIAPALVVHGGNLSLNSPLLDKEPLNLPRPLKVENLNISMFMELSSIQRFLDIDRFSARLPDTIWEYIDLNGQIFSDEEYLEFNGFTLQTSESHVEFSGEITPLNLLSPSLNEQFRNASYYFNLENSSIHTKSIAALVPDFPDLDQVIDLELLTEGSLDSMWVDRFIMRTGNSVVQLTGMAQNVGFRDFSYDANIVNLVLDREELTPYLDQYLLSDEIEYLAKSDIEGHVNGTLQDAETHLSVQTPEGSFQLEAFTTFYNPVKFNARLEIDSLNIQPVFSRTIRQSNLSGTITLNGQTDDSGKITAEGSADLDPGVVNQVDFLNSRLQATYQNNTLSHQFSLSRPDSRLETSGTIQSLAGEWLVSVNGQLSNIDLQDFIVNENIPQTRLSLKFNSEFQGSDLNNLYGRASYQTDRSIIGVDTLRPHQLYVDIDSPDNESRTMRLTSSFLDAEITGDIYAGSLINLFNHWNEYIQRQTGEEILFDSTFAAGNRTGLPPADAIQPANLHLQMDFKDITLLQRYFTEFPKFESQARIQANLNADAERLFFTFSSDDTSFQIGNVRSDTLRTNLTASFRYNEKFKEYGTADLQINTEVFSYENMKFREAYLNASMRNDSLMITHSSKNVEENIQLDFMFLTKLLPGQIEINFDKFYVGNENYEWVSEGNPKMIYTHLETLVLEDFIFSNGNERVEAHGTYSTDPEDFVEYSIRNLQLDRISRLIGGRVTFAGEVNGDFITRTLTQMPIIQGNMDINRFMLTDRLIGDIQLNSKYSPDNERFDTRISILTDPEKYSTYYAENDSIGQNLTFTGYLRAPEPDEPDRELFNFDADFHELDMWIVPVIVPSIVEEMEGRATGNGSISGTLNDYDFSANIDIRDVKGKPAFVNTTYDISGNLLFNRQDGLVFQEILLEDEGDGRGVLQGTIDLNDFSGTSTLDLTLDLENLQFLNNPYDPDVPFYATIRGTGQVRATGTNFDPFLRTSRPIVISQNSRVTVPLLDETELEQSHNFIQFVDSFDFRTLHSRSENGHSNGSNGQPLTGDLRDLTFSERFTLDLQFIANDQITFELIFDRVTNEVLTANGTGQMRLRLEDQNFTMFGRMNIMSGEYQFVAGDIISRRFLLQQGGSIIWEGDPNNARLDVNATYRARPDLSSLIATTTGGGIEGGQRFPIDLVLNIGGTLGSLENDFYFNIPSSIEGTLDPTLTTQINALNRNNDEKIIQATSILLTGNFIPPSTATSDGGTGQALRQSLAGSGSMVVNPLISSQIINPLLSDQINSLLRSDMALDIDFNLTPYNQIDLGVALRLYDDRLILRREGQITGTQSDIGDLGATYRINRTFALTAFHRQDPTLANTSGTDTRQVQEMNGVGVEAQVQFNSWKEFRRRIGNTLKRLFGIKESENSGDKDENEPLASEGNRNE